MTKIAGSIENWENGALGLDEQHAVRVPLDETDAIEKAACMQPISIRLNRELISILKEIAKYHGIGYQPMVRDLLQRFALSEIKDIMTKRLEATKEKEDKAGEPMAPVGDFMRRAG